FSLVVPATHSTPIVSSPVVDQSQETPNRFSPICGVPMLRHHWRDAAHALHEDSECQQLALSEEVRPSRKAIAGNGKGPCGAPTPLRRRLVRNSEGHSGERRFNISHRDVGSLQLMLGWSTV